MGLGCKPYGAFKSFITKCENENGVNAPAPKKAKKEKKEKNNPKKK